MSLMSRIKNRWASSSYHRTNRRVANNLGKIKVPKQPGSSMMFRKHELEVLDAYYESRQYDHLAPWGPECDGGSGKDYVPIKDRRPLVIYNFTKLLCSRLTSKLVGEDVFPTMKVEDDPDTTEYLRFIIKASKLKSRILEPVRQELNSGSVFVRFYIEDSRFVFEHYLSKYCYPLISASGELDEMKIRYCYEDKDDLDKHGNPKKKWFQLILGKNADISFDNPDFDPEVEPVFQQTAVVEHNLGFVQGEWMRTMEQKDGPDGYSLVDDILDFVDCLNYSLSQSDIAVAYNQDPQLIFKNIDEEEMNHIVKSATKSWNLGRDGEASYLEAGMNGVATAMELRDKMRTSIMDIARIILMDPEKLAGHAQSGRALEILHGPMVELVKELRPMIEDSLSNLVSKMAMANLIVARRGLPSPVTVPDGYSPSSLTLTVAWPPVFPMTIEDVQKKVSVAQAATSSFLISEETGTRYIAKEFGIEDVEEERLKIDNQPIRNPFSSF